MDKFLTDSYEKKFIGFMSTKQKEKRLKGFAVSPGISIGIPFIYVHEILNVSKTFIEDEDIQNEISKYKDALGKVKKDIIQDKKTAQKKGGDSAAKIFDTHLLIIEDKVLIEQVEIHINDEKVSARYAVSKLMKEYQMAFEKMNNNYFSERAFDIEDVCRRIVRSIIKEELNEQGYHKTNILDDKRIIVSNNIFPSDTINFQKENVLGFITEYGGQTSHAAILARSLEVPALVGVKNVLKAVEEASMMIVDGYTGEIILNPSSKTLTEYKKKEQQEQKKLIEDLKISRLDAVSKDGVMCSIASNMQTDAELDNVMKWGSEGVGLFRTEFLFEEKIGILTEEEQFAIYDKVAASLYPKRVIFRILDIGGDKLQSKITLQEDNPFLGLRGVRLLLRHQFLLEPHIRAILRASKRKNVWLMIPFVSQVEEVKKIKSFINKQKTILKKEGHEFDRTMPVGSMIEIPSAALTAETIVKESDFLSIGTNDLTQYTLAADRGNEKVAYLFDSFHPSVIKLIKMTADAAIRNGKYCSVCGEMAGDPLAVPLLLGLGIKNLSVTPFLIPEVKKVIRNLNYKKCHEMALEAKKKKNSKEVVALITKFNKANNSK